MGPCWGLVPVQDDGVPSYVDRVPHHELPDPVAAAPGATVVDFPWAAAGAAIAQLDAAATELANQLTGRAEMHPRLTDWQGRHRHDFGETYEDLVTRAEGIIETLNSVASAVVDGADDAVADQSTANRTAEREAADERAAAASAPPGFVI